MGPMMALRTRRAFIFTVVSAIAFFSHFQNAEAYTPMVSSSGGAVRWQTPVKFDLAGNPVNSAGLSPDSFYAAVVKGLQRWQAASGGALGFDYWQGTDKSIYPADSTYNGLSSIYFASNSAPDPRLNAGVLGLTQVWYDTNTGQILEADIVLNDNNFVFTTNPRDTSGYGSTASGGTKNQVFVENVITHELGHAFGLAHSGGLQSTMLFMESPEQAHLGCDEEVGIHALYPTGDAPVRGSLSGQLVGPTGAPIFGAQVSAISVHRGAVLATAMTDKSGNYFISGLEPGNYFLLAEPYYAGSDRLPQYYAGSTPMICSNGLPFSRTFLANSDVPIPVPVQAGGIVRAPGLKVTCNSTGSASVSPLNLSSSPGSAPVLFNGSATGSRGEFGITDRFSAPGTNYYKLSQVSGTIEAHAMSYSLYSPMQPTIALIDASGNPVPATVNNEVYFGDSGYVNYDAEVSATQLPPGDYYLEVTASALNASLYPAGPIALDSAAFLVITGSANESTPSLAGTLPLNARCRMNEAFAPYTSPPGNPPRYTVGSGSHVGFCGIVASAAGRFGGGDSGGPGAGEIAGWLFPWILMLALARGMRRWAIPMRLAESVSQG